MNRLLRGWAATALVFTVLDAFWLTQVAPHLYRPLLDPVLSARVAVAPAIVFYILYVTGLVILAVRPALAKGRLQTALRLGAMLGLVAYGAYDLTNQATLRVWDIRITLADMSWGALASGVGAGAGLWVARK